MVKNKDTTQWILQSWAAFIISLIASTYGVYKLPLEGWGKWFMILGIFSCLTSSFTLSKMLRDNQEKQIDTPQWIMQVWISFGISLVFTFGGLWHLDVDWWIKAYVGVAFLFALSSTFGLSKTIRDNQESLLSNFKKFN